jgi:thioredoxin-dependent peroxiredoxin
LKAYQSDIAKFDALDTQVIGLSVDNIADNKKFAEDLSLSFPLLSDVDRKVSKSYGVLEENWNLARRVTFVVDKEGKIQNIDQGSAAIDPTGAYQSCSRLKKS